MKHQTLLTIQAKLKLAFTFFSLFSRDRLRRNPHREGNFEVLKRCYIQIYPTSFLLCYGKAVKTLLIFNICETESGVMRSSCKRSSGTQLGRWYIKRDIPKFETVLLNSNWSSFRRKYFSKIPTDMNVGDENVTLKHELCVTMKYELLEHWTIM